MARALDVPAGWLQFGDGTPLTRDVDAERSEYKKTLRWYWRGAPPDQGRELGNAAGFAFEVDIPTLGRETGQNTVDEPIDGEHTISLEYTVIELKGEDLREFLGLIRFEKELRPHLVAAADQGQKVSAVIEAGLHDLEHEKRLILLQIADYNASGLTGPEYDTGRFMAVCRNTLDSQKESDTAGGSYGLGKFTMWASSWMGLVLTNSHLSVPEEDVVENRFFARLELPWHQVDGASWAGPAWFGEWDTAKDCTRSYAGNETLARDLYVGRERGEPGTTFLVVGAYDPSGVAEDIDEIAAELESALAENFWPAMVPHAADEPPRLKVTVRTQRGRTKVSEQVVNPEHYVLPMVDTLRRHYEDDIVDELDQPGDVVRRTVTLRVPERVGDDPHPACDHEVVILVAQEEERGEDDSASSTLSRVVYLRGNNMVIRDLRLGNLPLGARAFHAVVLAGEAAGDEPADRLAERFLRAAEPPAHNKWISTPEIHSRYARGARSRLDELEHDIRETIRSTVRGAVSTVSDGPESLKELLRLVSPKRDKAKRPRLKSVKSKLLRDGSWEIDASVTVPARSGVWAFGPVLKFGTESGPAIPVSWSSIEPISNCEIDGGGSRLKTKPGARNLQFKAVADPASYPVSAGRARVLVDIRDVRRVGTGS